MAVRPRDVYRGRRRKPRWILSLLLFIIALLIVGAFALFYGMQRYVVISDDGVYLDLPGRQGGVSSAEPADAQTSDTPEPGAQETAKPSPGEAVLVIDTPDFSTLELGAGEELQEIRALWASPDQCNMDTLTADYLMVMQNYGANALLLEVKDESGQLIWPSSAATAAAYGTGGTVDLQSIVTTLKEKNIYLVAGISCCLDNLLSSRNYLISLRNVYGGVYAGEMGAWLDPYNRTVRDYAAELTLELAAMGFDEVVLTNLEHPVTDDELIYSQVMSVEPDPVTAICNFALNVREELDDYNSENGTDVKLSAYVMGTPLREGRSAQSGQDTDAFMRIFDRMFCDTSASVAESDMALVDAVADGDMSVRFVPVTVYGSDTTSWVQTVLKTIG